MTLKKKLGMGVMSAALGLSLVGGGTFAYFSDKETTNNTFAAGTLDLSVNPSTIINVDNIKPGDTMLRTFKLANKGSLDIKTVKLATEYQVIDAKGDNTEDFAKNIKVKFMWNADKNTVPVYETTLADLKTMTPDVVEKHVFAPHFAKGGLKAGTDDVLAVKYEFVENGQDQNQFQGDKLELKWTFNAEQTEGEQK
ncbi:CalY family protein [Bacillus gaemokensis]|uniref:Cell division protein FtsN n=1 Tax=Bacillus gaemokensis TaxID=574375 RepID=A0A073KAL1_9BACI|nr:CalY family protein [Bacillus gaemokensis]KEK23551.1 cell division protein FtsN [Bacillus gaemokensis]KYG26345.1 cell division protein FtsN [Bacillus gaemokensis]